MNFDFDYTTEIIFFTWVNDSNTMLGNKRKDIPSHISKRQNVISNFINNDCGQIKTRL